MRPLSPAEVERHNAAFRRGCALAQDLIRVGDRPARRLTPFGRWRLKRAARKLHEALRLHPTGWQSMWFLGKVHQRLGHHAESLTWFRRSHELEPDNPDVAREAGLEALEVGDFSDAASFFKAAIRANSNDPGHLANLALANLLLGDVANAGRAAQEAASRNPEDPVSQRVVRIVQKVRLGERPIPRTVAELKRLA